MLHHWKDALLSFLPWILYISNTCSLPQYHWMHCISLFGLSIVWRTDSSSFDTIHKWRVSLLNLWSDACVYKLMSIFTSQNLDLYMGRYHIHFRDISWANLPLHLHLQFLANNYLLSAITFCNFQAKFCTA